MHEFLVRSEAELDQIIDHLMPLLENSPVVTLSGDLGTGKTTLVRAICARLNVVDAVSSPTFSIINTYLTADGVQIHHIDLYRLEKAEELIQIGIEDYLDSGELTFIEWPGLIEAALPDNTVQLRLEHMSDHTRKIVIL
ncbi:MAG: tRNA (adenosine(37)-N6)-threonylcarbamoyltransferase complex ATPase subunit type 1 TsaE [Saprospiraceae bacterium]|nr:tRNA (adenosine(37)-N6)-threonylcarbamoyltransferase complex ATPase subunit type 1 TsaE [Saprospiraceae bacterium]